MKKNTLYLINGITLILILLLIIYITNNYIRIFDRSLFGMQQFIISHEILITLLKKTIISTVLVVMGLACIWLYLLSYESHKFLIYAVTFFISAGVCITIWDTTVMFLAGREVSRVWNRAGDICLLLFLALFYCLGISRYKVTRPLNLVHMIWGITMLASAAIPVIRPIEANNIMQMVSIGYCIMTVYICGYFFYRKQKIRSNDFLMIISACVTGGLSSFAKMKTLSAAHSFYRNVLPFLILVVIMFFFLDFYQRHRTGILFGRENNRKLHELTRHKERITELIIDYCQRPINLLKSISMKLEKNYNNYEPEQEYLLSQMDGYLNEINRYVKNVGEYSGICMSTIEQYNVSVSIYVLIKNALNSLEAENIRWDYRERNLEKNLEGKLITGDPFQLIDANRKILEFLCHYRKNNRLDIETVIGDDSVVILFGITIDQIKRRELHRISRQFAKKTFVSSLVEQELVPISIAKQSIEQNHGKICFEQSGDQLSISYRLMLAEEKKKPEAEPETEKVFSDAAYHVVLISALPQQIELIEEYLIYENFDVKTFSSASEALRYIEGTRDINIIIAGDMFGEMDALSVCMEIRKEYALEQLPILMISHEKQRVLKMEPFLYVNDIIYEPFEYITLMQKLHSLIILQESAKESMLSRLDFLQAQMDPHFIFNTISTIMPLCMEEPEEAYRLLGYFSEYLRGSLYHKGLNTTILLEQELELIHAYLNIQEVRFSHMIRYILVNEVDETVKILPLIVEPIVENSVKHGRMAGKELLIRLEIRKEGNGIRFIIEDNGKGMSEEKVQAVLQDNSEEMSNGSYSIGLMNLRKRLQIYYQSVLRIESSEGEGTKISFTIPSDSVR